MGRGGRERRRERERERKGEDCMWEEQMEEMEYKLLVCLLKLKMYTNYITMYTTVAISMLIASCRTHTLTH